MQCLFFHNCYDIDSIQQLSTLPQDVKIYDVFGVDANILPSDIRLSYLPYLINKQISLTTQSPFTVGTIDLQFHCLDYQDDLLTNENVLFYIYINGDKYEDESVNGIIDLQLDINQSMTIEIKINNMDGYLPFSTIIEVK